MNSTTITDLLSKIDALEGTTIELTAERDELAFAAHVERNAKAVKRLAEISTELDHLGNEKATLEAAIAEAGRRAAAVSAAEMAEAERLRAKEALPIAERLAGLGAKADAAAKEYASCLVQIDAAIDELAKLGAPVPKPQSRCGQQEPGPRQRDDGCDGQDACRAARSAPQLPLFDFWMGSTGPELDCNQNRQHRRQGGVRGNQMDTLKFAKILNDSGDAMGLNRDVYHREIEKRANETRGAQESPEQAYARIIETPEGRDLFRAYKRAPCRRGAGTGRAGSRRSLRAPRPKS